MSVGIRLVGHPAKRGLIPRVPAPDALVTEIEAWLRREAADTVRDVVPAQSLEGRAIRADFHPAEEPVELRVGADGRVRLSAVTSTAGPGYHTWLCHLFRRLGTDLSIEWIRPEFDPTSTDETGYFWSGLRADVERVHLAWLRDRLVAASRRRNREPFHLGSFRGHRFEADAALVTVLGPRDDAWLAEALERPGLASDVWPWLQDAQDGRYLVNRALCLMWSEVRWRSPATEQERAVLDEIIRLLRRAFPLDPGLRYPWREWRDVLQYAGLATDPMTERIVREADAAEAAADVADAAEASDAAGAPPRRIGYRHHELTVVHAGWALRIPGSWAERPGDEEWWGGESGRNVTLAAVETGEGGEPMSAAAFLERVAGHLGPDALAHRDGNLLGRGRITIDATSGIETATLEGYSAVVGSGAAIKIEIHDPDDWEWALDLWRSLAPAA